MKCPICARELDVNAKFCAQCGKRVPRCPICGEILYERSRFCANDGTPLPEELFADFPPKGDQVAAGISAVVTEALQGDGRPAARPAARSARPEKPQPVSRPEPPISPQKKKKGSAGVIVAVVVLLLLLGAAVAGGTYYVLENGLPSFFTGADASSSEETEDRDDTGSQSTEADDIQAALERAEEYAADGAYDRALRAIQSAQEEYPRSRELRDAQRDYEEYYTDDVLAQVDQLMEEKRYDEAQSKLNEGLMLAPAHDGLLTKLGALEEAIAQGENSVPPVSMSGLLSVSATSWLSEPGLDLYHTPERTVDGDLSTAWVEGVDGNGVGEWIVFEFDQIYRVSGMQINAGYQKTADLYAMNNRPAMLTMVFSDGTEQVVQLQDINGLQDVPLYVPVDTQSVSLVISSVYGGTTYEDTVISEVSFY